MAYLPGQVVALDSKNKNATCDTHHDVPAVKRIVGDTDSFGSEFNYVCQACVDAYYQQEADPNAGHCEWCKKDSAKRYFRRDLDEGDSGPVYAVCSPCIAKQESDAQAELDSYDKRDEDRETTYDFRASRWVRS